MSDENQNDNKQTADGENVIEMKDISVFYDGNPAVRDVSMDIPRHRITALIGPSGCGKSTIIRCFNRMNDLIDGAEVDGAVYYRGRDIYSDDVDPVEIRRRVGMVFQNPNPFPKSIYDNVAYGPRLLGMRDKKELEPLVQESLEGAALWNEVKDDLDKNGLTLSGGQQQRLCIARAIALKPEVILMDEPASSLDPVATQRIEETMFDLKEKYTIIIVTHNMQQAQRASDITAFFNIRVEDEADREVRWGELAEIAPTDRLFNAPEKQETADYVSGQFG